jgi:adenosyl cobinamide kinase/adenosyl cobinamide phosphate guanylyltransferase
MENPYAAAAAASDNSRKNQRRRHRRQQNVTWKTRKQKCNILDVIQGCEVNVCLDLALRPFTLTR